MKYEERINFRCSTQFKQSFYALLEATSYVDSMKTTTFKHGLTEFTNALFSNGFIEINRIERDKSIKLKNNKSNFQQLIDLSIGETVTNTKTGKIIDLESIAKNIPSLDAQARKNNKNESSIETVSKDKLNDPLINHCIDSLYESQKKGALDTSMTIRLTKNNYDEINRLVQKNKALDNKGIGQREVLVKEIIKSSIYNTRKVTKYPFQSRMKSVYDELNNQLITIHEMKIKGENYKQNLIKAVLLTDQALRREIKGDF